MPSFLMRLAARRLLSKSVRRSRPQHPVDLWSLWLATALIASLATALQWSYDRTDLHLTSLSNLNTVAFVWMILSTTLLILLPALLMSHLLMKTGRRRTAWCVFLIGQLIACMLLTADLRIFRATNHHLLFYVPFLFQPQMMVEGGGSTLILRQIFLQLRVILLLLLLAAVACYWIMRGVYRWVRFPHRRRLTYAAPAAYAMAVLGVASFRSHVRCYDQLSVFIPRLPINLTGIGLGPKPPSAIPFDHALQNSLQQIDPQWQKAFAAPRPLDTSAHLDRSDPPNVIVLVIDSLRRDMFTPKYMPQFYARAQKGLILAEHRPGVNCTKMGLFTICYGRYALFRTRMLDAGIKPQLPAVFEQSGYHTTYLEGHDDSHFHRMWEYVGPGSGFDDTILRVHGDRWDVADHDILQTIARKVKNPEKPQFILTLLSSIHFPYFYPPGYEKFYPVEDPRKTPLINMDPLRDREPFFNFYKNAVGYMDDLLGRFLDRIDLSRNLVLIVADHGESFWDDGGITHGGRMSRILMSVPCVFIGAGVSAGKITVPTQHVDLLPTLLHLAQGGPVPVKHLQGRDLLADRLPPRKILLACPADDRRDAETFMVVRPNMALKLSWSHVRRDLEFDATVDNNGKSFSYQIPPTPTAVRWASQIARILKPCVR